MSKTLVIAEKPSVGRDVARVLPGPFEKHDGDLEGPEHVITWAVGHLVQLAEPEQYDPKFKKWRMADLPIVPDDFKLVVRFPPSPSNPGLPDFFAKPVFALHAWYGDERGMSKYELYDQLYVTDEEWER